MRFNETWPVFMRAMRLSLRNKVWLIIGLTQPLLYLALFGPLLKRLGGLQGFPRGSAWQVFTPGLPVQLGLLGALFVGFGLIAKVRDGVIERMRVTPASRLALLQGECCATPSCCSCGRSCSSPRTRLVCARRSAA